VCSYAFFGSSVFLCAGLIYRTRFERNLLAWGGEQNQSVPELMMQISLVDEAETCEKDWNDIWFRIWTNSFCDRLIGYGHSKNKN